MLPHLESLLFVNQSQPSALKQKDLKELMNFITSTLMNIKRSNIYFSSQASLLLLMRFHLMVRLITSAFSKQIFSGNPKSSQNKSYQYLVINFCSQISILDLFNQNTLQVLCHRLKKFQEWPMSNMDADIWTPKEMENISHCNAA